MACFALFCSAGGGGGLKICKSSKICGSLAMCAAASAAVPAATDDKSSCCLNHTTCKLLAVVWSNVAYI